MTFAFEPTRHSKLRRGNIALDVTTGISGIVISISSAIDGSVQVCLQPSADSPTDKAPNVRWIDEQACDLVDAGLAERFTYAEDIGPWKFGDLVADKVSGACGTITEFQLCRNGCILACVTPETDWGANSAQVAWFSVTRLEPWTTDKPPVVVKPDKHSGSCDPRPTNGRRV